ncbi:LPS-assembly protein LptD [Borrelia persica]|uniref:LPS-assembly protein LptD n=1 Tax=Borrelia persica TaxID=44448 RepID=UPI0004B39A7B|nr:LPS-assembly protein LptD [Borrelia persica]
MQRFLYGNVFKKSFVILILVSIFNSFVLFSQDDKKGIKDKEKLTLMQKANLRELEISSDEELKKWALKEGIQERDVSKIKSLLLEKFGISPDLFSKDGKDAGRYKIIIESTDNLENFTYELTGDENIIFKGRVNLIIEDVKDGKKHNIKGDKIIFNKKTKKLFSSGNVDYKLDLSSDEKLYFYGSELFVDFDSKNFLLKNGIIQKKIHRNLLDHIISFGGKTLKRLDNDASILENAFVTTSKIPEPYYSIKASKIWILPSGDCGILNAVFYIGRVPIFYIPFFFKPGDSLFFNPSLGYFQKRGLTLFNTIYLFGKKSVDNDKLSFLDFDFHSMYDSSKKPYIRNGYLTYFFAEDVVSKVNKDYVKLLFDIYSNLGFYTGVDLNLSDTLDIFKTFEVNFGIGFTRTVYKHVFSDVYRPFDSNSINYSLFSFDNINKGDIFGFEVPFRYLLKSKSEFLISDALFLVIFEHYSDPYVMIDFKDRLESATLFSVLNSPKDSSEIEKMINTFDWNLSSFYNRTFDDNSLIDYRLNNLGLTFKLASYDNMFNVKTRKNIKDPTRKWFYLERVHLPYVDLNFQKDIYNNNWTVASDSQTKEIIMRPKVNDVGDNVEDDKNEEEKLKKKKDLVKDLYLAPNPIVSNDSNKQDSFYIRFGINPYLKNNIFFDDSKFKSPQEFKYDVKTYLFDIKNKIDLKFYADFNSRQITFEDVLYLNTVEYNPLDKDYNLIEKDKKSEHSVINKTSLNILPFMMYPNFARSNIKFENKIVLYSFDKKYDVDSKILSGKNNTVFLKSPETFSQDFNFDLIYDYKFFTTSFAGVLKNTFESIYASSEFKLTLEFPYLLQEVGIGIKYDKKFKEEAKKTSFLKRTLVNSEPLKPIYPYKHLRMNPALYYKLEPRYLDYLKFSFLIAYDPLINGLSELSLKADIYDFKFAFEMKNDFEYQYDKLISDFSKVGSVAKLVPYSVSAQYKKDLYEFKFFEEKFSIGFGTDLGWKMNLQKFVDNEFWAEFTLKFKHTKFFELNFSTRSINTKTFRYFGGYMDQIDLTTVNFAEDILKSFNFFNIQDRKDSLFKIKKISTSFKFNFYDWKFVGEYSLSPDIVKNNNNRHSSIWRNTFSIYISWNFFEPLKSSFENNASTSYELLVNRKSGK